MNSIYDFLSNSKVQQHCLAKTRSRAQCIHQKYEQLYLVAKISSPVYIENIEYAISPLEVLYQIELHCFRCDVLFLHEEHQISTGT